MDSDSRIAIIRNILNQYPLSIGIFRELIQNSEDAKASKQVFLLDCRVHPPAKLGGKLLEHTNGPALLAFNDATFRPEDWKGILATFGSSKRMDISKIGKNGMGFRACFHITNYPQVFSEDTIVMLDPQGDFFAEGEAKVMLEDIPVEVQESLNLKWFQGQDPSPGTIIRLSLRGEHHRREISTKTISCQEVRDHFQSFIQTEMDICLLFLSSLQSIEFWVIEEGETAPSRVALASITPASTVSPNDKRRVETTLHPGPSNGKDWLIRWHSVPNSESQDQLSSMIGCDAKPTMEKEKLTATVALAIQTLPEGYNALGKLFTYLPLPSDTNYPCNIHAPFALTVDRQGLRNENEEGFVKGSDDHVRVEWNRYLFDTVIPVAWAKLLLDLSELNPDPFSAWPSTHHMTSGCSYWRSVPGKALRRIVDDNIPIWPVRGPSTILTYHPYKGILIAPPSIDAALLNAFASIGLVVTQPPQEIYDLAHMVKCHQLLTPELAHSTILELNPPIVTDRDKRNLLLDYLLSTSRAENIIGIPLIEQVNGSVIALSQRTDTSLNHVILGEQDHEVFNQFSPQAISITSTNLSITTTQLLKSPTLLNVDPLEANHVIAYVTRAPSHFGQFSGVSSGAFDEYVGWVSRFFEWLQHSPLEKTLCGHLHKHPLLPVQSGELKPISSSIFSTSYNHNSDGLVQLLQHIGLSFLHPGISKPAQKYLDPYLKSLNNPHHVFTLLPTLHQPLSDPDIHTLQDYILSNRWTIQRDPAILPTLRKLPIYNHMIPFNPSSPQSNNSTINYLTEWSNIPGDVIVKVVALNVTILPILPNTFFTSQLPLAQIFDQRLGITSNIDIIQLTIDHLQSQPEDLQARFLELLSTMHIPSTSLSQLRSIPFVLGADGNFHAPEELVDPTGRLANLLPPHNSHLPMYQTVLQKQMVDSLKSLSLLSNILIMGPFQEMVDLIIQKQDTQLSNLLLEYLNDNPTSWSLPSLLPDHPWLDTSHGLASPASSHGHQFSKLCNRILPLLKRSERIRSQKLLNALHWNTPPPLRVVVDQFKVLVSEKNPSCPEFFSVTSFLGSHLEELSRCGYLQELEQFVKGRSWVPTYGPTLTSTTFAIFKLDYIINPFKQIRPVFVDDKGAKSLLWAMGCKEGPSKDAIFLILQNLGNTPANEAITFLRAVPEKELRAVLESTGAHLSIIPTTEGVPQACSVTHFNDLGPHAGEAPLHPGHYIASDHIDRKLAQKLHLPFLSDIFGTLEMKENLSARISSVLLSYTKEQAFMEFLANAADAGATEFGITLNTSQHHLPENRQLISPSLEEQCNPPSLIIHNNSVFSPSDWEGICDVGSRDKQENVDGRLRIGRFGLGSLSMFYFTEVAMILSGCHVLFMDPRKAYLGRGRSCFNMSLEQMRIIFPAHLASLDGHYGYKLSMDEYKGTLFKLHLRTKQQAGQSTIYGKSFSTEDVKTLIYGFKRSAQHALLFIPVEKIKLSYPVQHRRYPESWVVEKSTVDLPGFGKATRIYQHLHSSSTHWSILYETIPKQDIPHKFSQCLSDHKIHTISVGIAGAIDPLGTPPPHHRPFFGVPLLDTISLPIHIHSTFILSDDRRSIRYDKEGDGNLESEYNKWLLTKIITSFYLRFLAGWKPGHPMKDCPWWPTSTTTDRISQVIVEAMKTAFPTSNELVCDTYSGPRIAPSKAHFLQNPCKGLLLALRPGDLATIPPGFSKKSSPSLQTVNSDYLTTILRGNASTIISMYKEGRITVDDVVDVARFLTLTPPLDALGLPLLPLCDGTLTSLSAGCTTYYCPPREHKSPWLPFPPCHFLNPKAAEEHTIYDSLQVHKLDTTAISKLIKAKVPEQDILSSSPELELWFKDLWGLLSTIPEVTVEESVFQQLPLIPTYSPKTPMRISFRQLTESDVLFVEHETDFPFDACVALGMRLIRAKDCQKKLKDIIKSRKEQKSMGARYTVIKFFMGLPSNQIPIRFRQLSHDLHSDFSQWFRGQLGILPKSEKAMVQRLPLWERVQIGSGPVKFVPAQEAVVIPESVDPDVVRRWATGSTEYIRPGYPLSLVKGPDTLLDFYKNQLTFPSIMKTMTSTYEVLLGQVLRSSRPSGPAPKILVPNANGTMTFSNNLYLSTHATFAAAFASQNKMFLHPGLRNLERQLCDWGLISTLTASSFRVCASAIDQDVHSHDIRTRALTIFRTYNTEMPPELMRDQGSRNALRNLRFIPRSRGLMRYGSVSTERYHSLPDIVSPSQIVDPKFFSIAWTQRATCLEEPSLELQSVNRLDSIPIWEPTTREVIKHLRVLSTSIAPNLQHNRELIEDLKATYSWLANHATEAEELLDYNQEGLFLNVDNPASEWRWNSASELLFDEKDDSNPLRVRGFLKEYGELLRAAGVQEVIHVSVPEDLLGEDSHETQLEEIRRTFNEMREAEQLTDVTFVAEDGTRFAGHRVFLAARSEHFKTSFTGRWRESRDLDQAVEIDVEYGQECLKAVLDWVYKGSYDPPAGTEKLNVFMEMYRLAHYWSFQNSDLFKGLTRELIKSIGVRTYETLRKLAEDLGLQGGPLADKCDEFERKNRSAFAEGL